MYHLFIASPESVIYNGQAKDLIAPGSAGYFEVLSNHAALITTLQQGKFEFTDEHNNKHTYTLPGGILEVDHNKVSVLADSLTPTSP